MSVNDNTIHDPREIGPFDRCLRCFTPLSDDFAFCTACGKISTVFTVHLETLSQRCAYHSDQNAFELCCLCKKPICQNCNDTKRQHLSIAMGHDLFYCVHCTRRTKELEEHFLEHLKVTGQCPKHPGMRSEFKCVTCALPLCANCSYFVTGGLFRRKIKAGPYCLLCFRSATPNAAHARWLSGAEVLRRSLL
jgi:hypothetical protein